MNLADQTFMQHALVENWRREMEMGLLYQIAADAEQNDRRKRIFLQLADTEFRHAKMWENVIRESGMDGYVLEAPDIGPDGAGTVELYKRIELCEIGSSAWYHSLRQVISDPELLEIMDDIEEEELQHRAIDHLLRATELLKESREDAAPAAKGARAWVGDAIYGVNDGLGAIFGIIAGVAGFAASREVILVSGFFGALASTLSMGAGAWLATKSENELMETAIAEKREQINEARDHAVEELVELYQEKGFTSQEAARIANQIAEDDDLFLRTIVQEELGFHDAAKGNPWRSAVFGSLSTFVGGLIPLIPFFFATGLTAMIAAAIVSLLAHFAVGAAKSLITVRRWWASGLEMTLVGVLVGVVSYGLGLLGSLFL